MSGAPSEAVARIVAEGGDADDLLRATVSALADAEGISWAGIAFLDNGTLTLGPSSGTPDEQRRTRAPIRFQGRSVGELWVDTEVASDELERVAALVAPYTLVGWDTEGQTWDP